MAKITKVKLPPLGKLKLETGENIAFLSGDVPRLILISGSDACDIYEGQCLPSNANSPYLQNPHNFEVSAVIGFGMMENAVANIANFYSRRLYPKSVSALATDASTTTPTTIRSGQGYIATGGNFELLIYPVTTVGRVRITVLHDASPAFVAAKPAGFMDSVAAFYDDRGYVNKNLLAVAGTFSDADIGTWVAAAGYTGKINQYTIERMELGASLMLRAKTAVFVSRDPNASGNFSVQAFDIGLNAEDFT